MIADTQDEILGQLLHADSLNSADLQAQFALTHEALYAELISFASLNYIQIENRKIVRVVLTQEGKSYAEQGTPEARIFALASLEGTPKEVVEGELKDAFKIGFGNAMKKKIVVLKDNKIYKTKEAFEDEERSKLILVAEGKGEALSKEDAKTLKGRKLIEEKQETTFIITKGEAYRAKKVELIPELTSAMIADSSWEKNEFKKFNPASKGLEL
jgi:phenylalanyl-tRNA synthetase alpha chain